MSTLARAASLRPSIALSVQLAPSRRLRALLVLAALLQAGAGVAVLADPLRFLLPGTLAALLGAAACLLGAAAARAGKARQIDISGPGEIRLTVQQSLPQSAVDVRLLPESALWPRCLVLRLAEADGTTHSLVVLPDSVVGDRFRALSVALRAIGGRGGAGGDTKK